MSTLTKPTITVETVINAPVEKVWKNWTSTSAIEKWNSPSPEWHTTKADHILEPGQKFSYRMEARDGSFGFDFSGKFDIVLPNEYLEYTLDDFRVVKIKFIAEGEHSRIVQTFEAEDTNPHEVQQNGWQAILDSFTRYVEHTA